MKTTYNLKDTKHETSIHKQTDRQSKHTYLNNLKETSIHETVEQHPMIHDVWMTHNFLYLHIRCYRWHFSFSAISPFILVVLCSVLSIVQRMNRWRVLKKYFFLSKFDWLLLFEIVESCLKSKQNDYYTKIMFCLQIFIFFFFIIYYCQFIDWYFYL